MLASGFKADCRLQQLRFCKLRSGENVRDLRIAFSDRAGFVERDDFDSSGFLKRRGGFEQDAVLRAQTGADHDCDRRRQTQRARAADHQHRNAARQRIANALAQREPDDECHRRNRNHNRNEYAGNLVRDFGDRRLGRSRVADHLNDLRKRGVLADARRLAFEKSGLIHRRSRNGIAFGFVHGNALAGQRRFVDRAFTLEHNAVHGNALAGANDEAIARAHLLNRYDRFLPASNHRRRARRELHQPLQRVGRAALRASLEHFANGNQRQDHCGGFEIEIHHIIHDGFRVAAHLRAGHLEQRVSAVNERGGCTEGYERIHVRRAMKQALETAYEEFLVDYHHGDCQKHLRKSHRNVIALIEFRQRPAPHHVPHRKIHEHQQKAQRPDQPLFQQRRFVILERLFGFALRNLRLFALDTCAVARFLNRGNDRFGRSVAAHAHRIRQKAYRAFRNARNLSHRLFHARAARRAAHAGDVVLLHLIPPFRLFHQLLHRRNQLVDHLVVTGADVVCDAGANMAREQLLVECVHSRVHRRRLNQYVRTVGVVFQHIANAANLPLDSIQTMNQLFEFLRRTLFLFLPAAALFILFHDASSHS